LIKNKELYDIIHAFDFDTGIVASRYAKKFCKKFVYHILDYYVDAHWLRKTVLENPILKLENSIINDADATIICTEKRKEQIAGSMPKRLAVIHNTPSTAQLKQCDHKTQQSGKIKIVYVGILEPSRLLREIAAAVSENSNLEFHVAGFGTLEAFFIEQAQTYDNIYFYGRLPYDHTLSLENECDIMLAIYDPAIDNHRFAAPNKFYESLMLGKPVIMVHGTGMSEVVAENGIGERIEFSKDGFIDGVNRLIGRKDEWPLIGRRMKDIYRNQYCWDEMERRLIQIYTEIQYEENTDR
jgi:glycosyltransferase involved in cell wall biosynthesis